MPLFRFTFRAMAAENELQVAAADEATARRAADRAIADVQRIEAKYSRYLDDSVTTLINRAAGTRSRAPATGATTATRATTTGTLGRESRRYNALCTPSGDSKGSR